MGLEALTDSNVVVMREREEQDRVTTPIKNQSKVVKAHPCPVLACPTSPDQ